MGIPGVSFQDRAWHRAGTLEQSVDSVASLLEIGCGVILRPTQTQDAGSCWCPGDLSFLACVLPLTSESLPGVPVSEGDQET